MINIRRVLAILMAVFLSSTAFAQAVLQIPVEQFVKRDLFGDMRLSPTGEYIAVTVPLEDRTNLVILRRSDMKQTGFVGLESKTYVNDFYWVNPTRILFTIAEKKFGQLEMPTGTGEIYGVNADGSGQRRALIGYRADSPTPGGSMIKTKSNDVNADILDTLKDDDQHVLIEVYEPGNPNYEVQKMNVDNGTRVTVAKAPLRRAGFRTDNQGVVRFVVGYDNQNNSKTFYKSGPKSDWVLINDQNQTGFNVLPIGMSADNNTGYLEIEETKGPNGVYALDTATMKRTLLVKDDTVNPYTFLKSPLDQSVYAIVFKDGYPRTQYLDPQSPYTKINKSVQATLKDKFVLPVSYTKDGNLGLFLAYADNSPAEYYLYDRMTSKISFIAANASWIKAEQMAQTDVYQITTRDGMKMDVFVTIPKGSDGKNLPMVVHPHGGPFGVYDGWGYDAEVQMLANRGYAVLQVNFRGSDNYGREFEVAGYKQYGGTMQDDLTDATRWAIKSGIANPKRICIYGASYGGYASLMGVVKEPDLYACAIGDVGVYDMNMMYGRGDIQDANDKSGVNYLERTMGRNDLNSISPSKLAARIKAPVLLLAGAEDERAPQEHSEVMQKALAAQGKQVELVIYPGEGHGNFLIKNQLDHANRVLSFLDKHIGPNSSSAK